MIRQWALSICGVMAASLPPSRDRAPSDCASAAAEEVLARVRNAYRGHSLSARFEQQYVDAVTGARPAEHGQVALDAAGRMRFSYESPEAKEFVFDGQSAAFVEPDARQVTVLDHFAESQAGAALSLLTGRLSNLDGVQLDARASRRCQHDRQGEERCLVFRPQARGQGFDRAELGIDPRTCQIVSVRVTDAIGNASVYKLSDRKLNIALPKDHFVRRVPAGFDVLHVDATPSDASRGSPTEGAPH